MLLNAAGRQLLTQLCGVEEEVLSRVLPSWAREDAKLPAEKDGVPAAVWRIGGAVAGPVAFDCRLCAAGRTGTVVRVVLYAPRWDRVCARHGRWLLDADADQPYEYLDVRRLPEVTAAQRRWAGVVRRGVRAGAGPERVFALAYAVVARWWEQALQWERETLWPRRLHQVAGGDAGGDLERWRIVGRDAVVFPEVVAVADTLLDPVMAELVWRDSGAGRPRALPADGMFCRRLGERVGRGWLGTLAATDHGGPLIAWMGSAASAAQLGVHPGSRTIPGGCAGNMSRWPWPGSCGCWAKRNGRRARGRCGGRWCRPSSGRGSAASSRAPRNSSSSCAARRAGRPLRSPGSCRAASVTVPVWGVSK
ncbi:hypothetical protein [Streptomyces sp. NPDC000994]